MISLLEYKITSYDRPSYNPKWCMQHHEVRFQNGSFNKDDFKFPEYYDPEEAIFGMPFDGHIRKLDIFLEDDLIVRAYLTHLKTRMDYKTHKAWPFTVCEYFRENLAKYERNLPYEELIIIEDRYDDWKKEYGND